MNQLPLFAGVDLNAPVKPPEPKGGYRNTDPASSRIAFYSSMFKQGTHKALIIEALERIGEGTSKELALACDPPICRHAAAKRCANLKAAGVVEVCGHREGTQEEVLRLKL
jgi:hypothetical protein